MRKAKFLAKLLSIIVRLSLLVVVIAILGVIIASKVFYTTSDQAFINTKLVTLRAPITGIVKYSDIKIGDFVSRASEVFTVSNPRFGNSEIQTQYNNLQDRIDTIGVEIDQNKLLAENYEREFKRYQELVKVGAAPARQRDEIENSLKLAKSIVENKTSQLTHLKEQFAGVDAQLKLQKGGSIVSPVDGVIWSMLSKDGEYVTMGNEIIQLVNPQQIWIDAFFGEKFAEKLRPGMKVGIKAIGLNEHWIGEIVFIRGGSGRVVYDAAVEIPPKALSSRLVAVRIKVDWENKFKASEFYGIGRSMSVYYPPKEFKEVLKEKLAR
jgi:multidrug resistance efflux pump